MNINNMFVLHKLLVGSAFVLLASLSACRPAPVTRPVMQDFDSLVGWVAPPPTWLTSIQAHSGQYACLADRKSEYVARYVTTWQALGRPRRVRLRAWAWLPHGRLKMGVVLQVRRGSESLVWDMLPVTQVLRRYQQWESAERDMMLPRTLESNDEVSLVVWQFSPVRDDVYLDDISLEKIR